MDSKEPDKYLYTHKRKAAAQLKRRNTYNQMSSHKKEELLLARRMKKQAGPEQAAPSCFLPTVPKKTTLTIREQLLPLEKVVRAQLIVDTPANNKKETRIYAATF